MVYDSAISAEEHRICQYSPPPCLRPTPPAKTGFTWWYTFIRKQGAQNNTLPFISCYETQLSSKVQSLRARGRLQSSGGNDCGLNQPAPRRGWDNKTLPSWRLSGFESSNDLRWNVSALGSQGRSSVLPKTAQNKNGIGIWGCVSDTQWLGVLVRCFSSVTVMTYKDITTSVDEVFV